MARLQHRGVPKVFHKDMKMQLNLWSQTGLDDVLEREPVTEHCIICKAGDRDAWEQHGYHFVHTYVSTKLEDASPLCVFLYLQFISCKSNFLSRKQTVFWDMPLPDLTLCSPCFICLNLLTENRDIIIHQWSTCSRELLQIVVSIRCFLRKHPQHSEYPQWMFKCINCKKYHDVFLKRPFLHALLLYSLIARIRVFHSEL